MRLDLEEFLRRYEISLESVRARVESDLGLGPDDALFAGGSLVEALGHPRSDLDLYLLTDRPVDHIGERRVIELGRAPVDLELWPWEHVERLLGGLAAMPPNAVRDPRDSLVFSKEDREFLHRLRVGVPLAGEDRVRAAGERVDPVGLARVLFDRACARIGTAQADLVGMLELEDYDTALFLIRMVSECTADCILAATGRTNPEAKWRFAQLAPLDGSDWDLDMPGGPVLPDVRTHLRRLIYPGDISPAAVVTLAKECVRLANRVIPWGQERFAAGRELLPALASAPRARPNGHAPPMITAPTLPWLSPDIHIRYEDGGYKVYPYEGGTVLSVNRLFVEVVVLYDGATTRDVIVEHLRPHCPVSDEEIGAAVADIETLLLAEQMLRAPEADGPPAIGSATVGRAAGGHQPRQKRL